MKGWIATINVTVAVVVLSSLGVTQMPIVRVDTKSDSLIGIAPLDDVHRSLIPDSLVPVLPKLPPGSFLLINHTSDPVMAVVALWSFSGTDGKASLKRINCDGYLDNPPQEIVKPNSMSLITPESCVSQDLFFRMRTGTTVGFMFSNTGAANHTEIQISLDSVIFKDGRIWGPDKKRYFADIWQRHLALKSLASDVRNAKKSGGDARNVLQAIRSDGESKHDKYSAFRAQYASLLQRSPNIEGTLQFLESRSAPPEFSHIGEPSK